MRILELFSGMESFSKAGRLLGFETLTLDNNPIFNPDICKDITQIGYDELQQFKNFNPDIIWASQPCETFSVASIGTHWTGGGEAYIPKTINARIGIDRILKTIYIINELKPKYWFIENPRGILRKIINPIFTKYHISNYKRNTITYCQYGDNRMKPTDIWTNYFDWQPRPTCKNRDPCHQSAPRGSKTGTQGLKDNIERSIVPRQLCEELLMNLRISND